MWRFAALRSPRRGHIICQPSTDGIRDKLNGPVFMVVRINGWIGQMMMASRTHIAPRGRSPRTGYSRGIYIYINKCGKVGARYVLRMQWLKERCDGKQQVKHNLIYVGILFHSIGERYRCGSVIVYVKNASNATRRVKKSLL